MQFLFEEFIFWSDDQLSSVNKANRNAFESKRVLFKKVICF